MPRLHCEPGPRRGVTAAEVLVVLVVLGLLALVVLAVLPRQRENARLNACHRNLSQIGVGLALYERSEGYLPTVPPLAGSERTASSPLKALLETLVLPDLSELAQGSPAPKPGPGSVPGERAVPGFVCFSDPNAASSRMPAPVTYRATAGDRPDGVTGAFAPGRRLRRADIENGNGLAFTAAFSERLVGTGRDDQPSPVNYALVAAPLREGGCPGAVPARWRGDAGSSWVAVGWRTTLYNHALTPNAAPSCVADDSSAAFMGASSGHVNGVNVLMFDGSVRTVTPTVAPPVWKALATTDAPATVPASLTETTTPEP
jgi:prepilin-type processing-associated H-X9-DG protein